MGAATLQGKVDRFPASLLHQSGPLKAKGCIAPHHKGRCLPISNLWPLSPHQRPNEALTFLARLLPPIGVVVGIYLLWSGADEPGGAFQGGAILAAMWILARMAGLVDAPAVSRVSLRAALVAGPVVFLAAGFADFALAEGFLTYPAGWEKPVIIVIETAMTLTVAVTLAIAATVIRRGDALEYARGGWAPPLGVLLRADGLSVAMLLTTAIVIGAAGLYARSDFGVPRGGLEARAPLAFWALLLTVWAGLNAAFRR